MFTRLVVLIVASIAAFVAIPRSAAAFDWAEAKDFLQPVTPEQLQELLDKLDEAQQRGCQMPWGRPDAPLPGVRPPIIVTFPGEDAATFWWIYFEGDVGATGFGPDGQPYIAFPPDAFEPGDDGWSPGEAASTVTHEMGHAAGFGNDDDNPDGTKGQQSEQEHFGLYKDDLKVLCDYLSWLVYQDGDQSFAILCDLCEKYKAVRIKANLLHHPSSADIPQCYACFGC